MSAYIDVDRCQSKRCEIRSGLSTVTFSGLFAIRLENAYSWSGTLRTRRSRSTTRRRVLMAEPGALKFCSARTSGVSLTPSMDLSSAATSKPATDSLKLSWKLRRRSSPSVRIGNPIDSCLAMT